MTLALRLRSGTGTGQMVRGVGKRPTCPSTTDTWRIRSGETLHMSLNNGHMAHPEWENAPHVPQPRTHGAVWKKGNAIPTIPTKPTNQSLYG